MQAGTRPGRLCVIPAIVDETTIATDDEAHRQAPDATITACLGRTDQGRIKGQTAHPALQLSEIISIVHGHDDQFEVLPMTGSVLRQDGQFPPAGGAPRGDKSDQHDAP